MALYRYATSPDLFVITDKLGRQFKNLRVSLTASCNYACTYCVPAGSRRQSAKHELSAEQLIKLTNLIQGATSLDRLRITGGEPLISAHFEDFISLIDKQRFADVSLTTNGQLLQSKVDLIVASGIKRINISLDTLNPEQFVEISKGGDLFSVLSGVEAALAQGLRVRVNMVPLRRKNLDQILPVLEYCLDKGVELRYIELMRMGHLKNDASFSLDYCSMEEILGLIARQYEYLRADAPLDSTSVRFEIPSRGFFGIIANESQPFCASCTRLRLSSSGHLHGCLSSDNRHYIGDLLTLPDDEAEREIRGRMAMAMADKQLVFSGGETVMKVIGG